MSSSSSSRPPSVNLRCHEQVLLLDSPTTTTTNVVDADDSSQPPRRYYFLFGQNSNQLSIERERFHRISLRVNKSKNLQIKSKLFISKGPKSTAAAAATSVGRSTQQQRQSEADEQQTFHRWSRPASCGCGDAEERRKSKHF